MWNEVGTHTRTKPMAHNFTHSVKVESREKSPRFNHSGWLGVKHQFTYTYRRWKGGSWGADLNDSTEDIFVIRCDVEWCMMWNVCGLDGLQSVKWRLRMVWWRRAYGVKWCRETAVWCGMSSNDFKCFVVWIRLYVVFRAVCSSCIM